MRQAKFNPTRRAVVALGGNAITRPGQEGTVDQDFDNLEKSLGAVVDLIEQGYDLLISHGNGPQVGNQLIRVELSRKQVPDLPLHLLVADLQGGLGYMIERVLRSKMRHRGIARGVCCTLTMVEVDANDPAFADPTKFVGPFYQEDQVEDLQARGWTVKQDPGRGWRRVVPSPMPQGIVEWREITSLLDAGVMVISAGGGGIPVKRTAEGELKGVNCVVDTDHTAAMLALAIGAPELIIVTGVERVMLGFGTPEERPISVMRVREARQYNREGHFPAGSMGPKVDAACRFVEGGGSRTLITHIDSLRDAMDGKTGTWITP